MIPDRILIWTTRGYQNVNNVHVGDRVISYNPKRNCTEYDTISNIETKYVQQGLLGIKKMDLHYLLTPDHPILTINPYTKETNRLPIDKLFMKKTNAKLNIIGNRIFEPYRRTQDSEHLEWTARLAASASRQESPSHYSEIIWDSLRNINGEEAQIWLNTFFHWNILKPRPIFMKTILLRSKWARDMVYHTAPRAGVGTFWGPYKNKAYHYKYIQAFSIGKNSDHSIHHKAQWRADRQEGIVYNISTQNGSFLARYLGGTFLLACNHTKGETNEQ